MPFAEALSFGLSAGGKETFKEVLVAVELSFKLSTPMEALSDESGFSFVSSSVAFCWVVLDATTVALRSVLLSGELGKLGSALSHVLVLVLVFGVVVELTTEAVFTLELESELTLLALKLATDTGKCSWVLTF